MPASVAVWCKQTKLEEGRRKDREQACHNCQTGYSKVLWDEDRTKAGPTSAKSHPVSDSVVLCPDSGSVDSVSCASCASCTQAPHDVASRMSGHPSQYRVLSGHMPLSNPASHVSRLQPQHHRPSGFTTTPEYTRPPSLLGV